jgi:hypothetical protein
VPSELDAATLPRGFFERQKDVFSLKKNSLGAAALAADAAGAKLLLPKKKTSSQKY